MTMLQQNRDRVEHVLRFGQAGSSARSKDYTGVLILQ